MNGRGAGQLKFLDREACPICQAQSVKLGNKQGSYINRKFSIRECTDCSYLFVENPCVSFDWIYDKAYYHGKGADPLVNYVFELRNPTRSLRTHELGGIIEAVSSITGSISGKSWLDYGCGNGTLVRHLTARFPEAKQIVGFEQGWIADEARCSGINILTGAQLAPLNGSFDVVTAIEVLEHVLDPLETLTSIRRLLKPGGLLFYTTANSAPFRRNLFEWGYLRPEVHIGYFNPRSISAALQRSGFFVHPAGWLPGFEKIIRFKILKTLGFKKERNSFRLMPWSMLSRIVDRRYRLSDMPMASASAG